MTKQEQYAAGLMALGFKEIESPSSKFRCFHNANSGSTAYFFLGRAGAVRYGPFKRITGATAATDRTKAAILAKQQPLPGRN